MIILTENNPIIAREKGYLVKRNFQEESALTSLLKYWLADTRNPNRRDIFFRMDITRHVLNTKRILRLYYCISKRNKGPVGNSVVGSFDNFDSGDTFPNSDSYFTPSGIEIIEGAETSIHVRIKDIAGKLCVIVRNSFYSKRLAPKTQTGGFSRDSEIRSVYPLTNMHVVKEDDEELILRGNALPSSQLSFVKGFDRSYLRQTALTEIRFLPS